MWWLPDQHPHPHHHPTHTHTGKEGKPFTSRLEWMSTCTAYNEAQVWRCCSLIFAVIVVVINAEAVVIVADDDAIVAVIVDCFYRELNKNKVELTSD